MKIIHRENSAVIVRLKLSSRQKKATDHIVFSFLSLRKKLKKSVGYPN